jgi:hypothetical protein
MSTYKLKQVHVLSVAKIGAILGLVWGLIWGIVMALWVSTLGFIARSLIPMAGLGAGLVLLCAIIFGLVAGFIGGAFWAFIYNVAAGFIGPIEMDLEA